VRRERAPKLAATEDGVGAESSEAVPVSEGRKARRSAETETPTSYGNFTLLGRADARPGRGFGDSVAIEGDVAVVGAPGFTVGPVACGAAYVFERGGGGWTQTARLDAPRPDMSGFARRVGVSGKDVIVFGGPSVGSNRAVFRTYRRRASGEWEIAGEVEPAEPFDWSPSSAARPP
jgi:hypothetical protein